MPQGIEQTFCIVGACENVQVWNLKTSTKIATFNGNKQVTKICVQPSRTSSKVIAVGYANGDIKLFNLSTGETTVSFEGHKSEITSLEFDHDGMRLVSGSLDTNVIVWDVAVNQFIFPPPGHKAAVTKVLFLKDFDVVVSCSKDSFVKFWDLTTQHCFKTLVDHRSEVWDMELFGHLIVTGSSDSELRIFRITGVNEEQDNNEMSVSAEKKIKLLEGNEDADENIILNAENIGSVLRESTSRVDSIVTDSTNRVLCVHGTDSHLEIFRINTDAEVNLVKDKRVKKEKKRSAEESEIEAASKIRPTDRLRRILNQKLGSKIKSCDLALSKSKDGEQAKIVCSLADNSLVSFVVTLKDGNFSNEMKVTFEGHRAEPKSLAFSSDSTSILSASSDSIKLWNRSSMTSLRNMQCELAVCSIFGPNDRQVLAGTKKGLILIFDIGSSELIEKVEAHESSVTSLCSRPDLLGLVSGSEDKTVKFWDYEQKGRYITIIHKKTLDLPDGVVCTKYSHDAKYIAVALLDFTVKVFFTNSFKVHLKLYGHKLPVVSLDISSDNKLFITASTDRNIKIWDGHFGNCLKSIFAHDEGVSAVVFVPKRHYFFSCGKDGTIKEWDGDKFNLIQTMRGHFARVSDLAISESGNMLVSCSQDRSIRLWEKSDEPLVLSDEMERERERKEEEEEINEGQTVVPGEGDEEAALPSKRTIKTVCASERIIESLDIYDEEIIKAKQHDHDCRVSKKKLIKPEAHPMLRALNISQPLEYVRYVICNVKSSELEDSLLVLSFPIVMRLLPLLGELIKTGDEVERLYRCLLFLLRIHHGKITTSPQMMGILDSILKVEKNKLPELKDIIGFNMAGIQTLKRIIEEKEETKFFTDIVSKHKKRSKQKKKSRLAVKT
ncbi:DgyrCDS7455 [Dimorphilus gyrociliatus]|uniref:DgyrCDS7455 n=1 Tax=Dimorphilus gyrociliatus TaxID=2664684 RepID=A0A7I8VR30_9ANNE|nr:DgyrCDS7455 [Dimorphilus gyrociliatus]